MWALALSVPRVSQGSSVSVSTKVMFTSSLKSWHYNKTKMPNVYVLVFKKTHKFEKNAVPCLIQRC